VKFAPGDDVAGHLDKNFWMNHLVLPLVAATALLFCLENTGLDLWVADHWYAFEGYQWSLRDNWLTYRIIHQDGKEALLGVGLVLAALLVAGYRWPGLRAWRKPLGYLLTSMALLPGLVAYSKHFSQAPCPWDMARYGGEALYRHNLSYGFSAAGAGHCFPAGHASGGFALLALYFAAYLYARRPVWFLLPGILVGFTFAFGQEARGAHFLSHDLWTMSLCWFGALGLFLLFRPGTWVGAGTRHGPS
jgi:membrane-associated PAP2 superfamily phosphatase